MKQLLSLWNSFPKKGKNKRSVLSRLAIFVCLLASAQSAWGDETTELFSADFTTGTWSITTGQTTNGILFTFEESNFSVSDGKLNMSKNADHKNYMAIKLTGVNGKVTVNIANGNSDARIKYQFKEESSISGFSSSNKPNMTESTAGKPSTFEYTMTGNGTDLVLYLGRQGSSYTAITAITVTTPSSAAPDPSANLGAPDYTNGYTWDFTNLDLSNITVGGNWKLNGSKYQNAAALSNANLIANNAYIPETMYLTFTATANNLWLSNS